MLVKTGYRNLFDAVQSNLALVTLKTVICHQQIRYTERVHMMSMGNSKGLYSFLCQGTMFLNPQLCIGSEIIQGITLLTASPT